MNARSLTDRLRTRAAGLGLALALALAALLASDAPPAQAQTVRTPPEVKLVSNTGQTTAANFYRFNSDYAQSFTTGSHADGYTLTRVDFLLQDTNVPEPTYTVKIHSDSSGSPGALVGTLTNPPNLPNSERSTQFTSEGITLAASTTYWVVFDVSSIAHQALGYVRAATSAAEDADALPGWSIGDAFRFRAISDTTWLAGASTPLKLAVHGFANSHTIEVLNPPTKPVRESMTLEADATTITLVYDRDLDRNSVPAASAFSVFSGTTKTVSSVDVTGSEVTLTLSAAITVPGQLTTVTYTPPSSNPIRGNPYNNGTSADAFSNQSVNWAPIYTATTVATLINAPPKTLGPVHIAFSRS